MVTGIGTSEVDGGVVVSGATDSLGSEVSGDSEVGTVVVVAGITVVGGGGGTTVELPGATSMVNDTTLRALTRGTGREPE
jgi:hypothetical protein